MKTLSTALFWLSIAVCISADATPRSAAAKAEFKRQQPCPATGKPSGACPGWVIDHITPLACGGADSPSNMQWQTVQAGKEKDRWERKDCR
jgi:5-methylcytosine-specific restriction endonuclease McrA